jgi:hypothetical protein
MAKEETGAERRAAAAAKPKPKPKPQPKPKHEPEPLSAKERLWFPIAFPIALLVLVVGGLGTYILLGGRASSTPGRAHAPCGLEMAHVHRSAQLDRPHSFYAADEKEESWLSQTEFAKQWRMLIQLNHFACAIVVNGGLVGELLPIDPGRAGARMA